MRTAGLVFVEVDAASPEAVSLISALDGELNERYPGMPIHGIDAVAFRRSGGVFLIARCDGGAVACGAIRPVGEGVGELKRMFVKPTERGRGFGRAMVAALEEVAARQGYRSICLETGSNQPEAIALYQSAGYRPISCYGEYVSDERSRCFEKALADS